MIVNEVDYDAYLEHFGVKGMKWGRTKKVAKVAAAGVAVAGAAYAVYALNKSGKLPVSSIPQYAAKAKKGKEILDQFKASAPPRKVSDIPKAPKAGSADHAAYKKQVNDVLADMKQANKEQDAWMRSLGLGAAVNADNAKNKS